MDKLDVSNVETKLFSKQPFQVKNVGQNCSNHFFLLNAIRVYLQEIFMNWTEIVEVLDLIGGVIG